VAKNNGMKSFPENFCGDLCRIMRGIHGPAMGFWLEYNHWEVQHNLGDIYWDNIDLFSLFYSDDNQLAKE